MVEEPLKTLWQDQSVRGLERYFDACLLVLREVALSYRIRWYFEKRHQTVRRNNFIDLWCLVELFALGGLFAFSKHAVLNTIVCTYILFEIFLSLFNILFIGKFTAINDPTPSIERNVLLMFINVLHLVAAFATLYRSWLGTSKLQALSYAIRVLGTVETPHAAGRLVLIVDLQILLDMLLLVIFLATFAGQVTVFRNREAAQKGRAVGD